MTDFASFSKVISGQVLRRGDAGFEEAVKAHNLAIRHDPDVVVVVADINDVMSAVSYARRQGLQVAVMSTGHGLMNPVTSGLLLVTRDLRSIEIDPLERSARIGAGVLAGELIEAAAPYGLTAIGGSSATVGVIGLTLGGGLGPLARSHGYSSDYVTALRVVDGSGRVVVANKYENSDLFWALRGGKDGLGIVVEAEISLPAIEQIVGGTLAYSYDQAPRVLEAWKEWTRSAPESITSSAALMNFPDMTFMPPTLRAKKLLMLRFASADLGDATRAQMEAIMNVAVPEFGSIAVMPASAIGTIHNDPPQPTPSWSEGTLLNSIDTKLLSMLQEDLFNTEGQPFLMVELRHLGGATRTDLGAPSAVGGRAGEFSLYVVATDPRTFAGIAPTAYDAFYAGIQDYLAPQTFINWWSGRSASQYRRSWPADTRTRLQAIRESVDADKIFGALNHSA